MKHSTSTTYTMTARCYCFKCAYHAGLECWYELGPDGEVRHAGRLCCRNSDRLPEVAYCPHCGDRLNADGSTARMQPAAAQTITNNEACHQWITERATVDAKGREEVRSWWVVATPTGPTNWDSLRGKYCRTCGTQLRADGEVTQTEPAS